MLTQPGTPGTGTNPEQLLAAGWSAYFLSATKLIAAKRKISLPAEVAIDAKVNLGTTHGVLGLAARLNVSLPGMDFQGNGAVPGGSRESRMPVLVSNQRQHRGEVQRDHIRTGGSPRGNTTCLKQASLVAECSCATPDGGDRRRPGNSAGSSRLHLERETKDECLLWMAQWHGSIPGPLNPKSLRGKVVLVNFWTYSCINSLRELPYMKAWAVKYKDAGLVVIGVHTPRLSLVSRKARPT